MDYQIIYSRSEDIREGITNLENDVERFIEEGWELQSKMWDVHAWTAGRP